MHLLSKFFGKPSTPAHPPKPSGSSPADLSHLLPPPPARANAMSELVIHGILLITRENWPHIQKFMKNKIWLAEDENFNALLANSADQKDAYIQIDDPQRPFIIERGTKRIQLWARKDEKRRDDPQHMILIQSEILTDPATGKAITHRPELLLHGAHAPFLMIFRMSCCAESSLSALVSARDKSGRTLITSVNSNPLGIEPGMGGNIFYNPDSKQSCVKIATTPHEIAFLQKIYTTLKDDFQRRKNAPQAYTPR